MPANYEARLLVINIQGPFWTLLKIVVHTAHMFAIVTEKITICEWLKKMDQYFSAGSSFADLNIYELRMLYWTHDNPFIIYKGLMSIGKMYIFQYWFDIQPYMAHYGSSFRKCQIEFARFDRKFQFYTISNCVSECNLQFFWYFFAKSVYVKLSIRKII